MMSPQVESFTLLAVVAVFLLSTGTSPAMGEGECNFGSNDVLQLVHNDPSRGREHRWVRDGDKYPGLLCQVWGSGAPRSLSDSMFYKNDVLIEAGSRINGRTLTFPTFTAEDQGQYKCGCRSTFATSNDIILYVTPPKSEALPPPFVVKYGNDVTISCPLNFITFGDLPTFYKVDWRNSQGLNLVDGSIVASSAVSFDNQTLQLSVLNVMSDEEYRCVITHFLTTRFINTRPSDPVGIRALIIESPVVDIFHKVTQGEILCSTQDFTTYPGDRYCLYVEDSGGERHEVECDDHPVSGNVKELKKLGNTAVCTVNRTIFNPPVYNDTTYEIPDAIAVFGGMFSLKCGEVGSCIPQGDWYHNGVLLQRNSTTLTVSNASLEDDGTYQCVNNGLNNSFLVAVYVWLGISPTDCDSKLNDICVKNIYRGQSVELCTRKTLTPSTPPKGRVTKFIGAHWQREKSEGNLEDLYECFKNGSCVEGNQTTPPVDYHRYSDVNESCITISDVQEDEIFLLELLVNPDIEYSPRTVTFAIQTIKAPPPESPSPVGNTDDVIAVPVSVAMVVVVIIVAIVVSFTTATIIVIKYKHSKLTTNPTQSDGPQEPPSSSPSNLTVYRKKDVKRFEKIGRGSFWKVYRGKLSDSRCAVKRLHGIKKGGDHEGLISKVLRELDMWSSLNHPNVISLYGIYHEDDINIPLLIIELMDKNLTDQLNSTFDPAHRKSLFPLKTKLSILSQVAGALDYLHCIKRVIHGDLTANNILLKENPPGSFTSKLTDFGMSRALNEQDNVMSTIQGTYWYMPPEVQNAGETTTKVDIYSFGVLCVHVLSHRFPKPLHALTMDNLGARVVVSEFNRYRPYLMELDDDEKLLEPLIEECLQYEPEDRLRPEEVIGQLNSIEGRLSLKETGPANPSHQPSVIHQQFSGPIVSGCTISGSVMNVGSFTDGNMQSVPVADTVPLPAPLEVIPEVSFGGNMLNTSSSLTAPSEVNPA